MNRWQDHDRAEHRTRARRLAAGIGSVALASCVTTALAEPVDGLYVAADIAANEVQDTTYVLKGALTPQHPTTFDIGYAGSLRLGYGWQGPRVEVELGHRSNEVNDFGPSGNTGPGAGSIAATTLMFNGYYDIDTGSRVTPFVGAGIGFASVDADKLRRDLGGASCCTGVVNGNGTVFAFQAMAGLAVRLASRLDLTFEYRYFQTEDVGYGYGVGCFPDGTSCLTTGSLDDAYRAQSLSMGVRWTF